MNGIKNRKGKRDFKSNLQAKKPAMGKNNGVLIKENEECSPDESFEDEEEGDDTSVAEEVEQIDDIQENKKKRKHVVEDDAADKVVKKTKLGQAALTKQPTAKEWSQLRETENLFHSNLFRLQIEEMLKEMKPKSKYDVQVKQWIGDLKTLLLSMKPSKKHLLSDSSWLKKLDIQIPISKKVFVHSQLMNSSKSFLLLKPNDVSVIGSYTSGCNLGPNIQLDVRVEIPKECFSKDDELNYKYHTKRALYLCYIAHVLNKSQLAENLNFIQNGDSLSPLLEVKPSGKISKLVKVNISAVLPADTFKWNRFSPSKSKISAKLYFGSDNSKMEVCNSPTPHYNSSVLRDMTANANEEYRAELIGTHANLRDGLLLLKVWLRQRRLDEGFGCFGGHIISMYVVYLLQARRLNNIMSSYQVARNVWNSLAQSDLCESGITLSQSRVENQPELAEFHEHFDVVFVDVTGFLNLCADVSRETFLRVRHESKLAVECLNNPNINSFQALFMVPKPLHLECDHIVRLQESAVAKLVEAHSRAELQMDYAEQGYPQALSLVLSSLRQGLSQRVSLLNVELPPVDRWPIGSKPPVAPKPITLGLVLDPEHAFDILDKGPEANTEQAEVFRRYWGEKCDLRRFQDGSITEAVVWDKANATASKKRMITKHIVTYLLKSKLGVEGDDVIYLADQFETVIESVKGTQSFEYGTGEEASLRVIKSFDALVKQLRQLPELPLDVSTVQGSSPVFRYADLFPPLATSLCYNKKKTEVRENCVLLDEKKATMHLHQWIQPVTGVIQLGMSGKWPDSLNAIRRIQTAFYVSIAGQLSAVHRLTAVPRVDAIDVLKDGYVFRLQIGNQREVALLKRVTALDGAVRYRGTCTTAEIEKRIDHLPKLTGALHGLHQRFAAYGPTCCLAKRWLRSQLLDDAHFPDVCVELLAAKLFVRPQPFTPPNQPQTAFFRLLKLLAATNWYTECLVLDLNDELTREDILKIEKKFNGNRKFLPPLFLATSFDHSGTVWTKGAPTLQILIRVAQLATEALKILDAHFFTASKSVVSVKQLFVAATDVYDVVICLNHAMIPRSYQSVQKPANKHLSELAPYHHLPGEKIPVTGFDPVQWYIHELRDCYGEFALFFHDTYGGSVIGVVWKPSTHVVHDFKVSLVNCHKLTETTKLRTNFEAMVEDFYIIGSGLVHTIEVKNAET